MKQHNITIRMGAPYWDAKVNVGGKEVHFDFRKMDKQQRRLWTKTLTRAWREHVN